MALPETVFSNNYKFQEISSWINCSLSVADLRVETFDIPVNGSLRPGGPGVPFTLRVKVRKHPYGTGLYSNSKIIFNKSFLP